jgi:hypothetical protein
MLLHQLLGERGVTRPDRVINVDVITVIPLRVVE